MSKETLVSYEIKEMVFTNILYFAVACIVLIISGIFLVKSLSKIARFLHISEFSAAFIIMAIATSLPELSVGISSALSNNSALSLGNVIGAGIVDLTLIAGILIILNKEIKTTEKIDKEIYFILAAILLLILLFTIGKSLSRIDGVILVAFYFLNSYRIFIKRKKYPKKLSHSITGRNEFMHLLVFIISLVGLFVSANFVVKYSSFIATDFNLSQISIGLFLLAFATTLPELVFGITAAELKHKEMGIGDLTGGVITTTTLVLGVIALISPIQTQFTPFITSAIFLFIAAFIFTTFLVTGRKLEKLEGISLILIYVLFIIIEFFIR